MQSSFDKLSFTTELWRAQGEYQSLLGHQIFCIDSDKGSEKPIILLIHGFPTSSWDWQPIWDDLITDYRVIGLDMLGFGFSDKPNNRNYSIQGQIGRATRVARAASSGKIKPAGPLLGTHK